MYSNRGRRKLKSKNNFAKIKEQQNTLVSLIQQNTNYNLCTVKIQPHLTYLHSVDKGYFVCNLKDNNGGTQHCIGVQKITKSTGLIFDCREKQVLDFSSDNLNKCCGPIMRCVSIPHMGEIRKKRRKLK